MQLDSYSTPSSGNGNSISAGDRVVLARAAAGVVQSGSISLAFRELYWPESTRHDLEILTSWIDSGQALLLGMLAVSGLVYLVCRNQWPTAMKAE